MTSKLPALVALCLFLSACGTSPTVPQPPSGRSSQLEFALASGPYGCERGVQLLVEREFRDNVNDRIHIGWNGDSYWLVRDPSSSGLPRFEDALSGLVWIDLPWKGLLLDSRTNTPIANECRSI